MTLGRQLALFAVLLMGACGDDGPGSSGDSGATPGADVAGVDGDTPPPAEGVDPGWVTVHRLNRVEYDNTVRDLLGTAERPAESFPWDDSGFGFDNNADVLSLSPLQLELYEQVAWQLAHEVIHVERAPRVVESYEAESEEVTATAGGNIGQGWSLWSNGELTVPITTAVAADYIVAAVVWGQQAGPELPQAVLLVDGLQAGPLFEVTATSVDVPQRLETTVPLDAGGHVIGVAFLNDYYEPVGGLDRNLLVDRLELDGPIDYEPPPNPLRDPIVTCYPGEHPEAAEATACATEILSALAARAWRRPATDEEVARLVALVHIALDVGDEFDAGLEIAVAALLTSPDFLFRVELDEDPMDPEPHPLSAWELASRLSYFLWSTMPDEQLFELAASGELLDPAVLDAQVTRMLADPRAAALSDNFAGQWLMTRAVPYASPDVWYYPDWSGELREAMEAETRLVFDMFVQEDRDFRELLDGRETFLTAGLAQHYGLQSLGGLSATPTRVTLPEGPRRGILGHGGLLTVLSHPTRTSPVKRGKWVLGALLCSEPDPPPPGVEGLIEETGGATLREQLEAHRADPVCAGCHDAMDPLGLALENFDGTGAWRDTEGETSVPIDASGVLPTGEEFSGLGEMAALLREDDRFGRCVASKLLTYALGRGMTRTDNPYLDAMAADFAASGYVLAELARLVVRSEPFRMRRGRVAAQQGDP